MQGAGAGAALAPHLAPCAHLTPWLSGAGGSQAVGCTPPPCRGWGRGASVSPVLPGEGGLGLGCCPQTSLRVCARGGGAVPHGVLGVHAGAVPELPPRRPRPARPEVRPTEGGRAADVDRERHGAADRARLPEGAEGWGDPLRVSPALLPGPPLRLGGDAGALPSRGPLPSPWGGKGGWDLAMPTPVGPARGFSLWHCLAGVTPKVPVSAGSPGAQQGLGGGRNHLVFGGDTWAGPS